MYYFSDSYGEGREKFHAACQLAGLNIESYVNPNAVGPAGEELAMDIVWCGSEAASRVLLVTSGTHGLEAAPGSATIVQWISDFNEHVLPDDIAVLFVHGVNAFGWAHSSRTNEDNVDINRNFLNHNSRHPQNQLYGELHEQMISDDISSHGLDQSIRAFRKYGEQAGENAVIHGVSGGQYTYQDGISYGGTRPSWSNETLLCVVRERLTSARKVIALDWHTGIGPFAEPFIILQEPAASPMQSRAATLWGADRVHCDDIFDTAGSPDYTGLLLGGLKREIQSLNGAEVLAVAIEWGTYALDCMLQALLMDRWLRFANDDAGARRSIELRTRLIERFYPSVPEWRHAVLAQSRQIYNQALTGLKDW